MIKNRKGFTLVEMLVVVAIIAILSSIFLVGLRGYRESAYDARRLSDIQKIQGNLELYYNKKGVYPSATDWAAFTAVLKGANIGVTAVPNDPISTQSYQYAVCNSTTAVTDSQGYVLVAQLSAGAKAAKDAEIVDTTTCTPVPTNPPCPTGPHTQAQGVYCIKI